MKCWWCATKRRIQREIKAIMREMKAIKRAIRKGKRK